MLGNVLLPGMRSEQISTYCSQVHHPLVGLSLGQEGERDLLVQAGQERGRQTD